MIMWLEEPHRIVAFCGEASIGAVFPPTPGGHYWRWRAWHTTTANPAEGVAPERDAAKARVEIRFQNFLDAAGLIPAEGGAA